MKKRRQQKKTILQNPVFWVIVILLIGIVAVLIVYFTQKSNVSGPGSKPGVTPAGPQPGPQPGPHPVGPLALGKGPAKITSWAWNSLVTGGFMGYGIFANKSNGYTWDANNKAVGDSTAITTKWDVQAQNTKASYAKDTDLSNKDSGSQFWDFISKKGSYQKTYSRRSLDGIKIQYDAASSTDMTMTARYKELLTNIKNEGLHVGILIGGKPLANGDPYHGIKLADMITQINNASDWIDTNKMGDYIYVSLDIEPADFILNSVSMAGAYAWYGAIFPQVATCIHSHSGKNVYYGMAINKNPYGNADAYAAWSGLISTNWKVGGKLRGFRVIELMYWWTAVDTQSPLITSHLASQLTTTVVGANPVKDAVKYGLYLQFGMECTGEVAYLMFADTNPSKQLQCTSGSCGTPKSPTASNCYRPQDGIIDVDTGIGFRCQSSTTKLPDGTTDSFSSAMKTVGDLKAEYWNTFKFNGDPTKYVPVYGFPYVAFPLDKPNSSSKYNLNECNALGTTGSTGGSSPEPIGKPGNPSCGTSMISSKSCDFLNKESWMIGGGLTNTSMEEFLHSDKTRNWLISIVARTPGAPSNPESIIFKIPFCVEDLSGYSGWLHNFKYGFNSSKSTQKGDLANFPDQEIKNGAANGSICMSRWRSDSTTGNPKDQGNGNIPCLGQTALSYNTGGTFTTDWVSGTLDFDGKAWTCPAQHYYKPQSDENVAGVY